MKKKATLNVNDKIFNLDIITGSENENALDISKLRLDANLITLDSGFKNTGSCQSAITFLDGEKGILRYRGYSIEELANKADFLEVAYLLIFGELTTKSQLEKISDDIKERSIIDEDLRIILNSYPKSAHPMGILSSLTSGLVAFEPSAVDIDDEEDMYDAILNLLAKIPVLVAWVYRRRKGLPLEYGDTSLSYVENLAKMMFQHPNKAYVQNKTDVSALNKLLILAAAHEQNGYTSNVRKVVA